MSTSIGDRLRDTRKRRGLTQRELATRSGVSLALVRKLEQGAHRDTRLETARKLAAALHVPTVALITEHVEEGATTSTVERWAPVRRALAGQYPSDDTGEAPTVAGVADAFAGVRPLFSKDRYAELAAVLPALLRDANVLAGPEPESRRLRVQIWQLAGWLLTQTRQFDAAEDALERALRESADRLQGAAVVNTQCFLLMRRGQLAKARELAVQWADDTEPDRMSRATTSELAAWGLMLLRASAASVRDNREAEAEDALRLARSAAAATGREHRSKQDFIHTFGPVTVALKQAENAMIEEKPDVVLRLAERVPVGGLRPTSGNRNRHLLDVANAQARTRRYPEAVVTLQRIRADSPEWLPHQTYARDIMQRIVTRRRTLTPKMRELADVTGVPM